MGINPFTTYNADAMIDRQLGDAFKKVRAVHDQLENIEKLARNLDAVKAAAYNMQRSSITVSGSTGALGQTSVVSLPTGIAVADILDSSVILTGSDGSTHFASGGDFSFNLEADGDLVLDLKANAPAVLANSAITWTVTYKTTAE